MELTELARSKNNIFFFTFRYIISDLSFLVKDMFLYNTV